MNEEDYISPEELRMFAKQNTCEHTEIIYSLKCKCCGRWWSSRTLIEQIKNDIINEDFKTKTAEL